MVLDAKQTTLAYRCPHCGTGVMSAVNMFSLSADLVKLKCTCGGSELTAQLSKDGLVRLTVPCLVCADPHRFQLNSAVFFGKELFTLTCPYSDLKLAFMGEINAVKAELAKSELELLEMMEKSGIKQLSDIKAPETALTDPQILEIVMFVLNELDAEGQIHCKCDPNEGDRQYDVEVLDDGVRVSCRNCKASRHIPTDSSLSAYSFLHADSLFLE